MILINNSRQVKTCIYPQLPSDRTHLFFSSFYLATLYIHSQLEENYRINDTLFYYVPLAGDLL